MAINTIKKCDDIANNLKDFLEQLNPGSLNLGKI